MAVSSAVAMFAIIGAGVCYHRLQRNAKATEDIEYPAYGVTGPGKETSPTSGGDRKLAQNAQMYHYQHQKQQMIAFDRYENYDDICQYTISKIIDLALQGYHFQLTLYIVTRTTQTGEVHWCPTMKATRERKETTRFMNVLD